MFLISYQHLQIGKFHIKVSRFGDPHEKPKGLESWDLFFEQLPGDENIGIL